MESEKKLAVLIDGDNIPSAHVKEMMEEIAIYGTPTIKRIYGDWTQPGLNKWKAVLLKNAIVPIQQYAYTNGKNATDSAMIIDTMDILYSDRVDGFCIVSSDSDFTRLATRLREAGKNVIGMGEKKTPEPFIAACDKFIYLEILANKTLNNTKGPVKEKKSGSNSFEPITQAVADLIAATAADVAGEDGWAFLGDVGSLLQKKQPNFDSRNYGFSKLTAMVQAIGKFDIEERLHQKSRFKLVYIRSKEQ